MYIYIYIYIYIYQNFIFGNLLKTFQKKKTIKKLVNGPHGPMLMQNLTRA